ncbi:MAG TPA: nuclear transport factor 2 family protein [Acidobacteriota bacterium]|nr:nuclear transport factor 2 family protein [Acidobacteriota bacterium]
MTMKKAHGMKPIVFALAAVAAIMSIQMPCPVIADDTMVTQETLLDRIQIEDLLIRYYAGLSSGSGHDLAAFFTVDAILDVNGMISEGRDAIEKLYAGLGEGGTVGQSGKMHMLLNNPVIHIKGDTAKAWLIWTGVMNDNVRMAPRLLEQGREYTELVKLKGRWFIKKRYITADSGMPALWDSTYKPREHP